jgi:hypothetical protein
VRPRGDDRWEDTLTVATTSAEYPVLQVPMQVRELPPLWLKPAVVVVRASDGVEAMVADVKVAQTGPVPVKITGFQAPEGVGVQMESDELGLPTMLHITCRQPANSIGLAANAIQLKLDGNARDLRLPIVFVGDTRSEAGVPTSRGSSVDSSNAGKGVTETAGGAGS